MELIRTKWTNRDMCEFETYLKELANSARIEWTKNILNTNLGCLALKSSTINEIANEIFKGNYRDFLIICFDNFYEEQAIQGAIISKIKDFNEQKKFLSNYANKIDSWATVDLLKFKINKNNEKNYFELAKEYLRSDKPFVRRIGFRIFFAFTNNEKYLSEIFKLINEFEEEQAYYVNMIISWLICELFIKQKEKTIAFLNNNKLNKFVINKSISKCRDSFRVSVDDKEMLLKYRK